jgi:hypothetical protein
MLTSRGSNDSITYSLVSGELGSDVCSGLTLNPSLNARRSIISVTAEEGKWIAANFFSSLGAVPGGCRVEWGT